MRTASDRSPASSSRASVRSSTPRSGSTDSATTIVARGSRRRCRVLRSSAASHRLNPPSRHSCHTGESRADPSGRTVARTATSGSSRRPPMSSRVRCVRMTHDTERAIDPTMSDVGCPRQTGPDRTGLGPDLRGGSMRRRLALTCAALALAMTVSGTTASAADDGGFRTTQPSMLTAVKAGVAVIPLLTVGDELSDGFRFESIPDGISVRPHGQRRVDLYVNHETSKVPFPYVTAAPSASNSESDFDNSQVSLLSLNAAGRVLDGSFAIDSGGGFQRFCSNYLATSKEGFDQDIFFTNEESPDYVFRQENSWPPPIGDPAEEENGVVLALDPSTGEYQTIYGMGRHNHENNVAIPGFDDLVVLSGDDTFTSGPLMIPPGGPNLETSAASHS